MLSNKYDYFALYTSLHIHTCTRARAALLLLLF